MRNTNIRSATITAGVSEAARAAAYENGDYGYLEDATTGAHLRPATKEEHDVAAAKAARVLDPDAWIYVQIPGEPALRKCTVRTLP